jgi:hypothetical protein
MMAPAAAPVAMVAAVLALLSCDEVSIAADSTTLSIILCVPPTSTEVTRRPRRA